MSSTMSSEFDKQLTKIMAADGFIAALDQSGGSTPKALRLYGIPDDAYVAGEDSMFDAVHEMRSRIMTSDSFNGDRILGSILFENTIEREVGGLPTVEFLWKTKNVVPFLKVSKLQYFPSYSSHACVRTVDLLLSLTVAWSLLTIFLLIRSTKVLPPKKMGFS